MHFIKKCSKQLLLAHAGNARIIFRSNSTLPISVRLCETATMMTNVVVAPSLGGLLIGCVLLLTGTVPVVVIAPLVWHGRIAAPTVWSG